MILVLVILNCVKPLLLIADILVVFNWFFVLLSLLCMKVLVGVFNIVIGILLKLLLIKQHVHFIFPTQIEADKVLLEIINIVIIKILPQLLR